MATEDFTTYTEYDPDDGITSVTATTVSGVMRRLYDSRLHKDHGAGHFTDYTHDYTTQGGSSDAWGLTGVWSTSNANVDGEGFLDWENADAQAIYMCLRGGGSKELSLQLRESENAGLDQSVTLLNNTDYDVQVVKSGTGITATIRLASDQSLIDTLSVTLGTDRSYRYALPCIAENHASSTARMVYVSKNLDLNEGAPPAGFDGRLLLESNLGGRTLFGGLIHGST